MTPPVKPPVPPVKPPVKPKPPAVKYETRTYQWDVMTTAKFAKKAKLAAAKQIAALDNDGRLVNREGRNGRSGSAGYLDMWKATQKYGFVSVTLPKGSSNAAYLKALNTKLRKQLGGKSLTTAKLGSVKSNLSVFQVWQLDTKRGAQPTVAKAFGPKRTLAQNYVGMRVLLNK